MSFPELPFGGSILRQKIVPTPWGQYRIILYSEPTGQVYRPFRYTLTVLEPGINAVTSGHVFDSFAPMDVEWPEITWMETTAFDIISTYLPLEGSNWSAYRFS
jgi:hypothetical protein